MRLRREYRQYYMTYVCSLDHSVHILELAVRARSGAVLLPEGSRRCPAMRWKVEVAILRLRPGSPHCSQSLRRYRERRTTPRLSFSKTFSSSVGITVGHPIVNVKAGYGMSGTKCHLLWDALQ